MAQVAKGPRVQISSRVPVELAELVDAVAAERGLHRSEAFADLAAEALGVKRPSEYLPRPKGQKVNTDQEAMDLAIPA